MTKAGIDIVIPWVDGSDNEWQSSFRQYAPLSEWGDSRPIRYRDWDLLRYWFRGIEQFMPWIDTIHFVTSGQIPEWLNLNHPKLNWVKHTDFIPAKYLPTFNANTIELNIHRIESLSEQFIYFNDDIFVLKELKPDRFFKNNLPCDYAVMTAKPSGGGIVHIAVNDLDALDQHFDKHRQMKLHPVKWFNLKYGKGLINNILLYPWKEFSGFVDPHLPNAFRRSTFSDVWQKLPQVLDQTCLSRFRTNEDVNQWLMRYWQLAEGKFTPYKTTENSINCDINDTTLADICNYIAKQQYGIICINDSEEISNFEKTKSLLKGSFEKILSKKSAFEKA